MAVRPSEAAWVDPRSCPFPGLGPLDRFLAEGVCQSGHVLDGGRPTNSVRRVALTSLEVRLPLGVCVTCSEPVWSVPILVYGQNVWPQIMSVGVALRASLGVHHQNERRQILPRVVAFVLREIVDSYRFLSRGSTRGGRRRGSAGPQDITALLALLTERRVLSRNVTSAPGPLRRRASRRGRDGGPAAPGSSRRTAEVSP
jgi:hypothetical protein